jgi:hypothetical protein
MSDRQDHTPSDPHWRWNGQRTDGVKTGEAAALARKNQFANLKEFEEWRRSKGMPDLDFCNLAWAYARFRGEPTTEQAVANPVVERR